MSSKDQFGALEVMCRERATIAKKEMEYWLAEPAEWKQLRESSDRLAKRRVTATDITHLMIRLFDLGPECSKHVPISLEDNPSGFVIAND
jgi:hypothetical protein